MYLADFTAAVWGSFCGIGLKTITALVVWHFGSPRVVGLGHSRTGYIISHVEVDVNLAAVNILPQ
jgi:hypothetical protein